MTLGFSVFDKEQILSRWDYLKLVARRDLRYTTPKYFHYISQTVVITPLFIGFFCFYLFGYSEQLQEVYLAILEDKGSFYQGALGLAGISLLAIVIYAWNHRAVSRHVDEIYLDHQDLYFDRNVINLRDIKTLFITSLPFVGVCIGLIQLYTHIDDARHLMKQVQSPLDIALPEQRELQNILAGMPERVLIAVGIVVLWYIALLFVARRIRKSRSLSRYIVDASYGLTALCTFVPILFSNTTLLAARAIGPLASTALVLIMGAVLVRGLVWALQAAARILLTLPSLLLMPLSGLPRGARDFLVVLVPLSLVGYIGYSAIEGFKPASSGDTALGAREQVLSEERKQFKDKVTDWLKDRNPSQGKFPVFVISAEGGGIYAATAISFFLASMQDHCPTFTRHIFAVSGVSGGSVGAALFDAAFKAMPPRETQSGCSPDFKTQGPLYQAVSAVTQADHLSPILAYLVPDLIRPILRPILRNTRPTPCRSDRVSTWFSRDQMLGKSLIYSFKDKVTEAGDPLTVCPSKPIALMAPYHCDWLAADADAKQAQGACPRAAAPSPALILNTTWVETGYRVAFAPFPLDPFGNGTLLSFEDLLMRSTAANKETPKWDEPNVLDAALVSAGFPIIMPPWILEPERPISQPDAQSRWTFVDGGYADSSGASTGLEIYNALKALKDDGTAPEIDPHLIVLTDAAIDPDFNTIRGGWFGDYVSPMKTLLGVRSLLSIRAVTEAEAALKKEQAPAILIQLDQNSFKLPLGWKLSRLTSDIVRLTIGSPEACPPHPATLFGKNSCALKRVADLLQPGS